MNKIVFMLIGLLFGNFLTIQSNLDSGPCEIVGATTGAVVTLVSLFKEHNKVIDGSSKLVDGTHAFLGIIAGQFALNLGNYTATLTDRFIKQTSLLTQNPRISLAQKINTIAYNTTYTVFGSVISLALYTLGGYFVGEGLGHFSGLGVKYARDTLNR